MSELLRELTSAAILGESETLRRKAKAKRRVAGESLPFAVAVLPIISGNDLEAGGYRRISYSEKGLARSLFLTASTAVARRLLQAHPRLVDEVLAHEYIKKHLGTGPLKRLPRDDQAVKVLRALLADSHQFMEYQEQGLFAWDNGDAQGAMAVVYGWRKVVTKTRGVFESVSRIHKGGRMILSAARLAHPHNLFLELIDHRIKLSWDTQGRVRRAGSIPALERLAEQSGPGEREEVIRLLSLASLYDAGLRFQDRARAVSALTEIQKIVVPRQPTHPRIMIAKAWAEALGGNPTLARQIASEVATTSNVPLRVSAAQVLKTVGDAQAAATILEGVSAEFVPRANPLASPTLRLP
jgi:hypothetical protein